MASVPLQQIIQIPGLSHTPGEEGKDLNIRRQPRHVSGSSQQNTTIYDTARCFSEVIDSPVSDPGKDNARIHRM